MLYEVITDDQHEGPQHQPDPEIAAEAAPVQIVNRPPAHPVITSYSIHYTKLYDPCDRLFQGRHLVPDLHQPLYTGIKVSDTLIPE